MLKFTVMSVLCSVVVCLAAVLALVWTMPDLPTIRHDQICLPTKDGSLQCGQTPDVLHEYLDQQIEKKYDEIKEHDDKRKQEYLDKNRDRFWSTEDKAFWEMKPAARLTGKEQPDIRKDDVNTDMVPIREWHYGRGSFETTAFLRHGIRYRNGRLVVPLDGTYFVYSYVDLFVLLDPSTGKPYAKEKTSNLIKHSIFKFNIFDVEETELISSMQPHTVSSNNYFNSYISYISPLADLKAGDELSVKVSNITYLKFTKQNYFGVNLI
ncbi:tumor necrosis factor ligand superfamily member 15-like [Mercenaria mercenaria]|uniref:tumor necrosis factor ligand superfamily member 15-like n=1 Tax=Mercenaria mercenaria TaxID=6596 RepID=UPI00234F6D58|nr:tumor necrosis factor ligand superfamily member 15-like [Mercenaria mercenaria]